MKIKRWAMHLAANATGKEVELVIKFGKSVFFWVSKRIPNRIIIICDGGWLCGQCNRHTEIEWNVEEASFYQK